ncbi:AAA family ATPase [Archangium sp.]|uniref:AAA family ATPase n=1 Tax=Archangium sp. TaxID=1872627 RepID=UPI002D365501|nr:AAA family ATPase [Archangium sp.]HYO52220.1 AAA family ATPase [Archangium sp.]
MPLPGPQSDSLPPRFKVMPRRLTLEVKNFGPIGRARVVFSDITVLVGPHATGKSLILQWLKLALDSPRILSRLQEHGLEWRGKGALLLAHYFGEDYQYSFGPTSAVRLGTADIVPNRLARGRARSGEHSVFYIPAHRALVMKTGWPLVFREHTADTPFVAREFGGRVLDVLSARGEDPVLVPAPRRFPQELRDRLDAALFHGGRIVAEAEKLGRKQLRLVHGRARLSAMEWTTGQREVVPLLLGLSWALPGGKHSLRPGLQWIVAEEPELGLHPDGIVAVLALLLETARRGYRLVLSTHSSTVLDVLWTMRRLREAPRGGPSRLCRLLGIEDTKRMLAFAAQCLELDAAVNFLDFDPGTGKVRSRDISSLDPASPDAAESDWGGLIKYASRAAELLSEDA